jgi:hypothetical protein
MADAGAQALPPLSISGIRFQPTKERNKKTLQRYQMSKTHHHTNESSRIGLIKHG